MFRRDRLSAITTSWPRLERCSDVGQPQKPSPPRTRIRILFSPTRLPPENSKQIDPFRRSPRAGGSFASATSSRPARLPDLLDGAAFPLRPKALHYASFVGGRG